MGGHSDGRLYIGGTCSACHDAPLEGSDDFRFAISNQALRRCIQGRHPDPKAANRLRWPAGAKVIDEESHRVSSYFDATFLVFALLKFWIFFTLLFCSPILGITTQDVHCILLLLRLESWLCLTSLEFLQIRVSKIDGRIPLLMKRCGVVLCITCKHSSRILLG